jgi:hypothetical protein
VFNQFIAYNDKSMALRFFFVRRFMWDTLITGVG